MTSSTLIRRILRNRPGLAGLLVLLVTALAAVVGGRLWSHTYEDNRFDLFLAPSWTHPMGTDSGGHDLLSQVLRGVQRSMTIAILVALLSTAVGVVVGGAAGYLGGKVDTVLMRLTDLVLTIPAIAILVVLADAIRDSDNSWLFLALLLAALSWTRKARLVRASFRSLRELEFVDAARAVGAGDFRIVRRHLLPNAAAPIVVAATLTVGSAVLAEAALSYIGFGPTRPDTSLGQLVESGQHSALTHPWLFYFPAGVIALIVLSVNLLGDAVRRAFDPTDAPVQGD